MFLRSRQSAQVLVLFALAFVVLTAVLGLVIDGGVAASQKQASQTAADGAALAAGYTIVQNSSAPTFAPSLAAAQNILTRDNLITSSLTLTYLQSENPDVLATTPAETKIVRARVSLSPSTYFLRILNYNTYSLTSTAEATLHPSTPTGGSVTLSQ